MNIRSFHAILAGYLALCLVIAGCSNQQPEAASSEPNTTPAPAPAASHELRMPTDPSNPFIGVYSLVLNDEQRKTDDELMANKLPRFVGSLKIGGDGSFEMSTSSGSAVVTIKGKSEHTAKKITLIPESINGQPVKSGADTAPTEMAISEDGQTLSNATLKLTYNRNKL